MPAATTSYTGYVPSPKDVISREPSSIDASTFFQNYVHARRPAVLTGPLPKSDGSDPTKLADLTHLWRVGADSVVRIEPFNDAIGTFGTAAARKTTSFPAFLDLLDSADERARWYLTTQYEADVENQDEGKHTGPHLDPICPAPTDKFVLDFPLRPPTMGNLVLQQCNLWIGNSADGSSSGLHHDFHDNLYLLLRGRKRFVLYPPSAHPYLHLRGTIERCWPNGLLVYKDEEASDSDDDDEEHKIRADGLGALDAAEWRVAHWRSQLKALPASLPPGATKEERTAHKLKKRELGRNVDAALEEITRLGGIDTVAFSDDSDEEEGGGGETLGDADDESDWSVGDAEDGEALIMGLDGLDGLDGDSEASSGGPSTEKREPPSFSRISPRALHTHLGLSSGLSSSAPTPAPKKNKKKGEVPLTGLVPSRSCPPPLVVDLAPGEMLYLPAGWFHEVTSGGGTHVAFNYWFHPPDGASFEHPYEDKEAWAGISTAVEARFTELRALATAAQAQSSDKLTKTASMKRKAETKDSTFAKRTKTAAETKKRNRPGPATRARRRAMNAVRKAMSASGV